MGRKVRKPKSASDYLRAELSSPSETGGCRCRSGNCARGVDRRDFLKAAGAGVASFTALLKSLPATGLSASEMPISKDHRVPPDKALDPEWIRGLYAKGSPELYRGEDLDTIGMPVGGIGAGQLYLLGDGRLGLWQIFNKRIFSGYGATNWRYRTPDSPVEQGFAVLVESGGTTVAKRLDRDDFPGVEFQGEYPIGRVRYAEKGFPVRIEMKAFPPFIPLNTKDSTLPATLFQITIENRSKRSVRVRVLGWLENATCFYNAGKAEGLRRSRTLRGSRQSLIVHTVEEAPRKTEPPARPRIVFADFEGENYGDWTATGEAFGSGPAKGTLAGQQKVSGFLGKGLVNTFLYGDKPQGILTSPEFVISRRFINFLLGGGKHPESTCINLVVDGKVVRTETGADNEKLTWHSWRVEDLEGKKAQLQIVDHHSGGWGHINVDQIEFADLAREEIGGPIDQLEDYGSMVLGFAGKAAAPRTTREILSSVPGLPAKLNIHEDVAYPLYARRSTALLTSAVRIAAGGKRTFTFVLAWHFPNHEHGHEYANRFRDAVELARYVLGERKRLAAETHRWHDTYYESTLPHWLLNRLHSTISNLATGTCQYWKNGRFWAWEGVGCCQGTCTHVWNYEHGLARLFPELERSVRERQDLDSAFHDDGLIGFRGERNGAYAADGQAGSILKCYREHQMSPDGEFLRRHWKRIRKALEYLIGRDANDDGLIEDSQHNTYDISFFGPNTFVGSLYLAALRAAAEMAREMGDDEFARRARNIFESGSRLSVERLWNGEYFVQIVDLAKHKKFQYAHGCLSDQLFGQGWAHQLALGYIYPAELVSKALQSIWKYNWAPDVGPQNKIHKPERWFITPGEAGLFTCTWPKSKYLDTGVRYKNEVWTGIEYQVAGDMVWEGMIDEALVIVRAIHDRYHPSKHNPWNEIECGDHYARAMASWGVFTALCGYEHHGPKGHLAFAPRMTPEDFRAAFTAAEGWGSFAQRRDGSTQRETIEVRWGKLRLNTLAFALPENRTPTEVRVKIGRKKIKAKHRVENGRLTISFHKTLTVKEGESLEVSIS